MFNLTCAIWINRWLHFINYCWWSTVKRKLVYKYLFNYSGSKYLLSSIYSQVYQLHLSCLRFKTALNFISESSEPKNPPLKILNMTPFSNTISESIKQHYLSHFFYEIFWKNWTKYTHINRSNKSENISTTKVVLLFAPICHIS